MIRCTICTDLGIYAGNKNNNPKTPYCEGCARRYHLPCIGDFKSTKNQVPDRVKHLVEEAIKSGEYTKRSHLIRSLAKELRVSESQISQVITQIEKESGTRVKSVTAGERILAILPHDQEVPSKQVQEILAIKTPTFRNAIRSLECRGIIKIQKGLIIKPKTKQSQ